MKGPTVKQLRAELMDKLVNVRGFSRAAARKTVAELQNRENMLMVLADVNGQGLFPVKKEVDQSAVSATADLRKKVAYNFQIEQGRLDALRAIADGDGVSVSHLIRLAVRDYLRSKRADIL